MPKAGRPLQGPSRQALIVVISATPCLYGPSILVPSSAPMPITSLLCLQMGLMGGTACLSWPDSASNRTGSKLHDPQWQASKTQEGFLFFNTDLNLQMCLWGFHHLNCPIHKLRCFLLIMQYPHNYWERPLGVPHDHCMPKAGWGNPIVPTPCFCLHSWLLVCKGIRNFRRSCLEWFPALTPRKGWQAFYWCLPCLYPSLEIHTPSEQKQTGSPHLRCQEAGDRILLALQQIHKSQVASY